MRFSALSLFAPLRLVELCIQALLIGMFLLLHSLWIRNPENARSSDGRV